MPMKFEDPIVTHTPDSPVDDLVETHPAYAQIGASRVTSGGGFSLYGSDFKHHGWIVIRVNASELHRGLSRDWHFARDEYIEVALSEAQWATFVSSLNTGGGIPCTLQARDGKQIPQISTPPDRRKQFAGEVEATAARAVETLRTLRAQIKEQKISAKAAAELIKAVDRAEMALTNSIPFVAKQFAEHVETVTEHAKVEINAHVQNVMVRAGLDAIKHGAPFTLPAHEEEG